MFLAGVLHENRKFLEENSLPSHTEEDDYLDDSIFSGDVSNFDTEYSAFLNGNDTEVEYDDYNNLLVDDWDWYQ